MQFDETPKRLHALTVWMRVGAVMLLVVLFYQGYYPPMVKLAIAVAMAMVIYLQWYLFTFHFDDQEIHVNSGILQRSHRIIPYERIQQVQIKAGVVPQFFDLATVVIENASQGFTGNITLAYLRKSDALALQRFVLGKQREIQALGTAETDTEITKAKSDAVDYTLTITNTELFKAGVTSDAAVAAVFGGFLIMIVGAAIGIVIALALSLLELIVRYNYKLQRSSREYQLEFGLLNRQSVRMPIERIQKIVLSQNPVRRVMDCYTVHLYSAAVTAPGEMSMLSIPMIKRSELHALLQPVIGEGLSLEQCIRVPAAARWRVYGMRLGLVSLFIVMGLFVPFWQLRVAALIALVAAVAWSELAYRGLGYRQSQSYVVAKHRTLFPVFVVIPQARAQELRFHRGIVQRWIGTASLLLPTAGQGKEFRIIDAPKHTLEEFVSPIIEGERVGEFATRG